MQAAPRRREPGGRIPDLSALVQQTVDDVSGNVGPHLLAVVVVTACGLPIGVIAGVILWIGVFGTLLGGAVLELVLMAVSALGAVGLESLGVPAAVAGGGAALVVIASIPLPYLAAALLAVVGFSALGVVLSPLHAAWQRAVARDQRGEGELDPRAIPGLVGQDIGSVLLCSAVVTTVVTLALVTTGPGALVPMALLGAAPPLVSLHRVPWWRALHLSARYAVRQPRLAIGSQAGFWALSFVAGAVPLLGPAFLTSLYVRAWRAQLGDGPDSTLA